MIQRPDGESCAEFSGCQELCKTPLFTMDSWDHWELEFRSSIRWMAYTQFENVREETRLHHECTHTAKWKNPSTDELIQVMFKKVDGQDARLFDFRQVNRYSVEVV
jgi:hypothetical protein